MDQTQILLEGEEGEEEKEEGKKSLLGGGLTRPLWLHLKTFSDAFLPAANINK